MAFLKLVCGCGYMINMHAMGSIEGFKVCRYPAATTSTSPSWGPVCVCACKMALPLALID